MGQVLTLPGGTLPVDQVLELAKDKDLKEIVLVGVDSDGDIQLFASKGKLSEIHFLLARMQHLISSGAYGFTENV